MASPYGYSYGPPPAAAYSRHHVPPPPAPPYAAYLPPDPRYYAPLPLTDDAAAYEGDARRGGGARSYASAYAAAPPYAPPAYDDADEYGDAPSSAASLVDEPLDIQVYDWSKLKADYTVLIVGKRNTGKSTMLRYIMFQLARRQALDIVVGCNPTEGTNHNLEHFLPPCWIYDTFAEAKLAQLLEWQDRTIANNVGQNLGIILDDILGEKAQGAAKNAKKRVMHSDVIDKIMKIGRQRRIFFITAVQDLSAVPESFRGQCDLVIAFTTNSRVTRKKIHETFFDFLSDDEFRAAFAQCTTDYCALAVDTRLAGVQPRKAVFIMRAEELVAPKDERGNPILPLFKVGKAEYWDVLWPHFRLPPKPKTMDVTELIGMEGSLVTYLTSGGAAPRGGAGGGDADDGGTGGAPALDDETTRAAVDAAVRRRGERSKRRRAAAAPLDDDDAGGSPRRKKPRVHVNKHALRDPATMAPAPAPAPAPAYAHASAPMPAPLNLHVASPFQYAPVHPTAAAPAPYGRPLPKLSPQSAALRMAAAASANARLYGGTGGPYG